MKKTQSLYEQFQHAIITGESKDIEPRIRPHPRLSAAQQAAVYSDGYRIRLQQTIEGDYPALLAHLGAKEFGVLAQGYIALHPSVYYNLDHYSMGFAAHVAAHAPGAFAAELARLEEAIAEVFNAPETPALPPATFAQMTPEAFGASVLKLRGALRLLAFGHPVNAWLDAQRAGSLQSAPQPERTWLCVLRHNNEVKRIPLEEPAFLLLSAIGEGRTVEAALDAVAGACPDQLAHVAGQLQPWFSGWVAGGVFAL